jgi:hypothetical protein
MLASAGLPEARRRGITPLIESMRDSVTIKTTSKPNLDAFRIGRL